MTGLRGEPTCCQDWQRLDGRSGLHGAELVELAAGGAVEFD